MIITVDGPAGAGKGTIAAYLANFYNLKYLDTGLLYRGVALKALQDNVSLNDRESLSYLASKVDLHNLKDPALRHESTANVASEIAVLPEVREILTHQIRLFCQNVYFPYKGAVLDGRDIGTVVYPNAYLKFFITADPEIREKRRYKEMRRRDCQVTQPLLEKMKERDARDSGRMISPLIPALDAHIIDTSNMSIQEACLAVSQIVGRCLPDKKYNNKEGGENSNRQVFC